MPDTRFDKERMLSLIEAESDRSQLAILLELIQATHDLDDIGRAVKRLGQILPRVKLFNPTAFSRCDIWLKILTELSLVIDSPEYQSQIKNPFQLRRHSTKRIASNSKGHEFYMALIVDIHDTVTESCIISTLAIILAFKTLDETEHQSQVRTGFLADGLRKANIRESAWERMLQYLTVGDGNEPKTYFHSITDRFEALTANRDTSSYKKDHWDFAKQIVRCVQVLIDHHGRSSLTQITGGPVVLVGGGPGPTNSPRPPKSVDDDSDQLFLPLKVRQIRSTPSESINYDPSGLAPDDYQTVVTQLVAEPLSADDEPLYSVTHEQVKARFSRYISEIDNQYLPIRWGALNPNELDEIVGFLQSAEPDVMRRSVQLILGLTLATGQTFDCLLNLSLAPDQISVDCRQGLYRYERQYFWAHLIPPLENAYCPDSGLMLELMEVGEVLSLPLPSLIGKLIGQTLTTDWTGQTLASALPVDSEALRIAVAHLFTEMRRHRRNRSRLSRLRSAPFDSLMFAGGDELAAHTLLGLDSERPLTGLYYTTFNVEDLRALYRSAIDRLLPTQTWFSGENPLKSADWVGSKLAISVSRMQRAVSELRKFAAQGLRGSRDLEKIRTAHNQYTNYVVMQLMCTSGHRAVNDPFHDPSAFLLEHSAVLITDKVELQEHEGRLVWLGDVTTQQYQCYLQHLDCLALALSKFEPRVSQAIQSLLNPMAPKALPLFFYLTPSGWESIRPGTLSKSLGSTWPWPLNANRHFLASQLRRLNVPAEYISYQLGHMQMGQMPFGQFSLLSPKDVGAYVIPALTELQHQCGWECLPGLRPYGKNSVADNGELPVADMLFGAALREHRRSDRQVSDAKLVLTAIRQVNAGQTWEQSAAIPDEFVDAVTAEIEGLSSANLSQLARRHNLFRRFLSIGRHRHRWHTKIPSLLFDIKGEKAPLNYTDGADLTRLKRIREAFLQTLMPSFRDQRFPPSAQADPALLAEYLACCRLAGLLFGQLCQRKYLDQLPRAIASNSQSFKGRLWVNFYEKRLTGQCLKYRWFPDAISSVLIIRWHHIHGESGAGLIGRITQSTIGKFETKIIKTLCKTTGVAELKDLEDLITWVQKDNALQFPGVVRAILNQDIESWSPTESAWQRVMTGAPMAYLPAITASNHNEFMGLPQRSKTSASLKTEKSALKALRQCLLEAQAAGAKPDQAGPVRNSAQSRSHLMLLLEDWRKQWHEHCSSTLFSLYEWVIYLTDDYTSRTNKPLKLSSILTYYNAIATPLIEECWQLRLSDLDDEALEQVYENVLNYGEDSFRPTRAAILKSYHEYLVIRYGAQPLDFDELEPRNSDYGADANFVKPSEYETAWQLLLNDHYANDLMERRRNALMLCLIYRNGLRVGEALRLLISDVMGGIQPGIYIRNNQLGTCKSVNGIRQIPLFQRLSDEELGVLEQWIASREHHDGNNPKAPFFARDLLQNTLVSRQHITTRITEALRCATGDAAVKIRHLRHSFATYFVIAAMDGLSQCYHQSPGEWSGLGEDSSEQFAKVLFGQSAPTRRMAYQLAGLIGHGSPETTFLHYVHCTDTMVSRFRPGVPAVWSGEDMMRFLGYSPGSLRTMLARKKRSISEIRLEDFVPDLIAKAPEHLRARYPVKSAFDISLPHHGDDNKRQYPALDSFAHMMSVYSQYQDFDFIVRHYFYTREQVQQWINKAGQLQLKTGYTRFNITTIKKTGWSILINHANDGNKDPMSDDYRHPIALIRNNIDRNFVSKLENALESNNDDCKKIVELWWLGYRSKSSAYYFEMQFQAEQFLVLLEHFGISRNRIYLEIPSNFSQEFESNKTLWQNWMILQRIPTENIKYVAETVFPRHTEDLVIQRRSVAGIGVLSEKQNNQALSISTEYINYYIFLISVLVVRRQLPCPV